MSYTKRNLVTCRLVSLVGRNGQETRYDDAHYAPLLHQTLSERRLEQALRDDTACRQAVERILKAQRDEPQAATRPALPPLDRDLSARLLKAVIGIGLTALVILSGLIFLGGV